MKEKEDDNGAKDINRTALFPEVRKMLAVSPSEPRSVEKPIIFDGRQYSIRVPKEFADAMRMNPKTDLFVFTLTPQDGDGSKPKLQGELKQDG